MSVPSVFVSYSHKDEIWKDRLRPHLQMLEKVGRLTIWDDRHIDAGATWYDEIKKAMKDAEVAICLISADYLASDFCVKEEIPYFLERRKSAGMLLLPILIRPCAWKAIDWLKAIQMLPRDGKSIAVDFKDDPDTPFMQVAERILALSGAFTGTMFVPEPEIPRWSPPEKVDVDRLPVTGKELFGRQNELKILDEVWESGKTNVISFVAWGGVGKSTLINKWREQLETDNYRGAKRVFAWSFYSQGTGGRVTSADLFIAEALKWFGDEEMANSNASPWDKGGRLAELVQQEKTLLLLDGMEPLQSYFDFDRGKIKDPALAVLVTELAKENHGLCVITTRENVVDLVDYPKTTQQINLEQISAEAGRALLRVGGVQGTDAKLEQAARDFGLHALALNLLAAYIHEIPKHHISNASEIPDIDVPLEEGKHPRRVMSAFAKRFGSDSAEVGLLRILGLFSSPARKGELAALRAEPLIPNLTEHIQKLSDAEWLQLIQKLRQLKLIAPESRHRPNSLDAHPLVREHFGKQLKSGYPYAWRSGHSRLFEYYTLEARVLPRTTEEMAPLYAAVTHGCQAGRYQEALDDVFIRRIQRGKEFFNKRKLGAFGAELSVLSAFFDLPWQRLVPTISDTQKSYVLSEVGSDLDALGQLEEATHSMQAGLDIAIAQNDWGNAAAVAGNLGETIQTIGDLKKAVDVARQSVELANRSGNWQAQIMGRARMGTVLYQTGQFTEAADIFNEAESIQKQNQPSMPFLYAGQGFEFRNFLLSQGKIQEVQRQAATTLKQLTSNPNVPIMILAFENLSLGRAHLLQSQQDPNHPFDESLSYIDQAVDGLRHANDLAYLPHSLLTRAEYYRVTNDFIRAQKDLDEAFTIATRGGMGLHLADCHLEYARLYLAKGEKAKAHEHWQIAKDSIEKMGYHRRDKEVGELEEQLK